MRAVVVLCVNLFFIGSISAQQCFVPGRCSGNQISATGTDAAEKCLSFCQGVSGCEWFSYDTVNMFCSAFSSCTLDASQTNFVSGENECVSTSIGCGVPGECEGDPAGQGPGNSVEECIEGCSTKPDCKFWTFRPDNNFCVYYSTCTLDVDECPNCVSGDADCGSTGPTTSTPMTTENPLICEESGECGFGSTSVGSVSGPGVNYDACSDACEESFLCQFFTFYEVGDLCLLYSNCDFQTGCPDCTTGQKGCPGTPSNPDEYSKILIALGRENLIEVEVVDLPSKSAGNGHTVCNNPSQYPIAAETAVANVIRDRAVLCGGGFGGSLTYSECNQLNPQTNSWEFFRGMKLNRAYASSVTVPGLGWFVMGGFNEIQFGKHVTTEWYDEDNDVWEYGPNLPYPVYGHCSVQIDQDRTFLAGGNTDGEDRLPYAFVLDWTQGTFGTWNQLPDLNLGRESPACGLYKDSTFNYVVVTGGLTPDGDTVSTQLYNLDTELWENGPDLPFAISGGSIVNDGDVLILLGGDNQDKLLRFRLSGWEIVEDETLEFDERKWAPAIAVPDKALNTCIAA